MVLYVNIKQLVFVDRYFNQKKIDNFHPKLPEIVKKKEEYNKIAINSEI